MNRRLKSNMLLGIGLLVFAGLGGWRMRVSAVRPPPAQMVLILDRSPSVPLQMLCGAAAGIADAFLRTDVVRKGSAISILAIGDDATHGEPVELGRVAVHGPPRALAGRRGAEAG